MANPNSAGGPRGVTAEDYVPTAEDQAEAQSIVDWLRDTAAAQREGR